MNPLWAIALVAAIAQLVLAILLAANYGRISHTPVGKAMVVLAALFLVQGVIATATYYRLASEGYGMELAAPLAAITVASLAGLSILYIISRT
ncbi:hypothetical protein apy_12460 [Aeropyrum pernix]|uniref:Uncharacterized protein n=1 Tax=Aeropyrum pernix TaxID=56636 RepID=A0A401HAP1_AERPX|nr:hypothetical protein [Aeropyrum pernix]GBF09521.1 hypothetical protein apy_12460 [Aeropyrum pernix]